MRDIEQQRIALECLKLAAQDTGENGYFFVVQRASHYFDFVTGREPTLLERAQAQMPPVSP